MIKYTCRSVVDTLFAPPIFYFFFGFLTEYLITNSTSHEVFYFHSKFGDFVETCRSCIAQMAPLFIFIFSEIHWIEKQKFTFFLLKCGWIPGLLV